MKKNYNMWIRGILGWRTEFSSRQTFVETVRMINSKVYVLWSLHAATERQSKKIYIFSVKS